MVVSVQEGCSASLSWANLPVSANVVPSGVAPWGSPLQELRNLKEIVVPDGTEKIGNYWFWGSCTESVSIPASVKEIGTEAFCRCKRLKRLVFGGTAGTTTNPEKSLLKMIGVGAFCGCTELKSLKLPDGLEEVGICAFRESGLENIALPCSTRIVHQGAFYKCKTLKEVLLNEGLETLGTDEYQNGGEHLCGVFEESAV